MSCELAPREVMSPLNQSSPDGWLVARKTERRFHGSARRHVAVIPTGRCSSVSSYPGITRRTVKLLRWIRDAARQGHVGAQYFLGAELATGENVAKNPKEAAYWYRRAAMPGHGEAQYNLAMMC